MKDWVNIGATQWFSTRDPWIDKDRSIKIQSPNFRNSRFPGKFQKISRKVFNQNIFRWLLFFVLSLVSMFKLRWKRVNQFLVTLLKNHSSLFNHWNDKNRLNSNQSGFCPGDTSVHQLLAIRNDIYIAFDKSMTRSKRGLSEFIQSTWWSLNV